MATPIHPLRRFLFERQITLEQFAATSGLHQGQLSRIMNWKVQPTLDTITRAIAAAGGKLKADDFIHPDRKAKK